MPKKTETKGGRKRYRVRPPNTLVREGRMGNLKEAHYRAITYYMQGMSKTQALMRAGYSPEFARARQNVVFERLDVLREIERRRNAFKNRTSNLVDRIKDELSKIAFFNIGEIVEVTKDGDLIFDFSTATMDQLAAIGEVTIETYVEGRGPAAQEVKRFKVKPISKKEALDSLARIMGMFKDNLDVTSGGQSLEERLQAGRKRLGKPVETVIEGEFEEVTEAEQASRDAEMEYREP